MTLFNRTPRRLEDLRIRRICASDGRCDALRDQLLDKALRYRTLL